MIGQVEFYEKVGFQNILSEMCYEYLCCFANKLRKIFIQSAKKKRRLKGF